MSIRKASKHYGIDKMKLHRVIHGVQKDDAKVGKPTAMPKEVEDILAQKLMLLVKNHMYLEMVNFPFVAIEICEKLGIRDTSWVAGRKCTPTFSSATLTSQHAKLGEFPARAPSTSTRSLTLSGLLPWASSYTSTRPTRSTTRTTLGG